MSDVDIILTGKVCALMNFGAFVQLEDGSSGLVHISEISKNFVKDIKDFLYVGQTVKVIALATEHDGKKRLSIKKADDILIEKGEAQEPQVKDLTKEQKDSVIREQKQKRQNRQEKVKAQRSDPNLLFSEPPPLYDDLTSDTATAFEDKLARYIKESDERLVDMKRQNENKRGGGYVRRG